MSQHSPLAGLRDAARAVWRELTQPRGEAIWIGALFGGLALAVGVLVWGHRLGESSVPPWLPDWWRMRHADAIMGVFAAVGLASLVVYVIVRRWTGAERSRPFQLAAKIILSLAVLLAGFNYFYLKRTTYHPWAHTWDSYHYLLGPKYFDEVEYYGLYECTVEALDERVVPKKRKVRNLETHGWTRAHKLRATEECADRFGPERWAAFEADLQAFAQPGSAGPRRMRQLLLDQGYNGPPFHAFVAGRIANAAGPVTFEKLNRLALIDIVGVCVMLFVVTRRFGWKLGLVFSLFLFTDVIDRFGMTGGSFFRLYWLVTLGLGISCLYAKHWGRAAFWLTVSTALNVFPLFFLGGAAASLLWRTLERRELTRPSKRFAVGLAVAGCLTLGLGAAHGRGFENYGLFLDNMKVHQHGTPIKKRPGEYREKMPTFGIGLKFPFLYRGQHTEESKKFGALRRSDEFREIKWIYRWLGIGLSLWTLAVVARLRPYEACILGGVAWFFFLEGTVAYYFACVGFLVLMWASRMRDAAGPVFVGALFLASIIGHVYLYQVGVRAVLNNTVMSWLLLVYLITALVHLSHQHGVGARLAALIAAPREPAKKAESSKARQARD